VLIISTYLLVRYIFTNIESFTSKNTDLVEDSLCSLYSSQPKALNDKCGSLTEKNCNSTSCCLWLNGETCVAGDENGPTFRSKNGENINVKYYSYKNNLIGKV
jgi:hypothetical protein